MSTMNAFQAYVALKPFIPTEQQPAALASMMKLVRDSIAVGKSAHEHRADDSSYGGACVFGVSGNKRCKKAVSQAQSDTLLLMQDASPALFALLDGRCLCGDHAPVVFGKPIEAQAGDDDNKTLTHLVLFTSSRDFTSTGHTMVARGGRAVSETVSNFLAERAQLFDMYTELTKAPVALGDEDATASSSASIANAENPATKTGKAKAKAKGKPSGNASEAGSKPRCAGTKVNGDGCQRTPIAGHNYCSTHIKQEKGQEQEQDQEQEQGAGTTMAGTAGYALNMQAAEPNDNDQKAPHDRNRNEAKFNLDDAHSTASASETITSVTRKVQSQSAFTGTDPAVTLPDNIDMGKSW